MKTTFLIFFQLCVIFIFAQKPVKVLDNSSFEQDSATSKGLIKDWTPCDTLQVEKPTLQPGQFGCTKEAYHGENYVALLVKEDGSGQSICQKFYSPLTPTLVYKFSCFLAKSKHYNKVSVAGIDVNFDKPAVLLIYLVSKTGEKQLVAESPLIDHTSWKKYEFELEFEKPGYSIILEAAHKYGAKKPYNGNILIDDLSYFDY